MGEHREQIFQECRDLKKQPWSKRRGALLALGLAISAICSVAWRTTTTEFGGRFDPATLSVGDLLRMFTETREYLYASGWREQDGTFVPRGQRLGEPKASTPRQFEMKRFTERVSKKNACGAGIRDVMHFTAQLPDVDAQYVMEALTNPGFTNWNPSLHFVMFRRHRRIPLDANLKDTFTPEEMEVKGGYRSLEQSRKTIDVSAQVAEIQIPRVVQKAAGRRFTSDFIAVRYDCKANRGFSIATSVGTEAVAEAAGVRKQQDLCLTSIMVAPGVNSSDTTVHIVSHFDPQVKTAMLQKAVQLAVGHTTRQFLQSLHNKA
ncbi:Translational activator GCN1, partial [Durusdinium trenchii]